MRDSISVGSCPYEEDCAAVGHPDYAKRARAECRAYIGQLHRMFGDPPDGCRLLIRSCPHDFGAYLDVEAYFNSDNRAAVEYAYRCENDQPARWDEQAREELGLTEVTDAEASA